MDTLPQAGCTLQTEPEDSPDVPPPPLSVCIVLVPRVQPAVLAGLLTDT